MAVESRPEVGSGSVHTCSQIRHLSGLQKDSENAGSALVRLADALGHLSTLLPQVALLREGGFKGGSRRRGDNYPEHSAHGTAGLVTNHLPPNPESPHPVTCGVNMCVTQLTMLTQDPHTHT